MENKLGLEDFQDEYLREVVKRHNMAETPEERTDILAVLSDVKFEKINKFNLSEAPNEVTPADSLTRADGNEDQTADQGEPMDVDEPAPATSKPGRILRFYMRVGKNAYYYFPC